MAGLSAEHINPFLMAAKRVLQDVCFVEVAIKKPVLKESRFSSGHWVIIVGITGEMRGQVLVAMSEESACAVASKMCMQEIHSIDDFSASALSELGNMIMGNAATVFSSGGIGIDITTPALTHGEMSFTSTSAKTLCVPLSLADGSGDIDMFLSLKQGG